MPYTATIRETEKGVLVAAADRAIIGNRYEEDGVTLHVREGFYGGKDIGLDALVDVLDRCFTANLVGNELIPALIDAGAVAADEVKLVDGMRHAQLFRL